MKVTKENINLEKGIYREWLISNGIGGYASSTIVGINTRRYHGLLVAPLKIPAKRYLILSKLDESIEIDGKKYDLYSNMGKKYLSNGYKYQISFEKEEIPIFTYEVEDIKITKSICMKYGENTVGILYKIKSGSKNTKLTLSPIINFRDFHGSTSKENFDLSQEINGNNIKITIDNNDKYPIYMNISEGKYIKHENDIYKNMFYIEEEKRGFNGEENHIVPGRYEIEIPKNTEKEISYICSIENKEKIEKIKKEEKPNVKEMIKEEKSRLKTIIEKSELVNLRENEEIIKSLITAADTFIVKRQKYNLHTMLAGYHWFLDWGRDSLIAFEGLLLKTKRYDIAREILLMYTHDIKEGLVPNGYSEEDDKPLYNSVDASLLLFEEVQKYIEYTNDYEFIKENIFEKLDNIINNYIKGIELNDNNIYIDNDGLIVSGTKNTQNTWMDAKIGDYAVTPRNGKAVEINSLWYNALKIMENLCKKFDKKQDEKRYKEKARKAKISFEEKFYNKKRKCLYDVLGDSKIRPNQLFSLSLTYPVIDPNSEIADNIIKVVDKKLLNSYGLKTLAKGEENYIDKYIGDSFRRDMSYHQGITWPWLLEIYYKSLLNMKKVAKTKKRKKEIEEKIKMFLEKITKTYKKEIFERGCIGSIAEIYDSTKPFEPKGTISQAWSVSAILTCFSDPFWDGPKKDHQK